jgi:hypothetical protein
VAILLACALLAFFRISMPEMTGGEQSFALRWGLLGLFGDMQNGGGAYTDQAPYLALGSVPFVEPPLPIWTMHLWMKAFSGLAASRILSGIVAALAMCSVYGMARNFLSAQISLFIPALLAGTMYWNEAARQADPMIWQLLGCVAWPAVLLWILGSKQHKNRPDTIGHSILALVLCFAISLFTALTSYAGMGIALFTSIVLFFLYKPDNRLLLFSVLGIMAGAGLGISWYYAMDFPYWGQLFSMIMVYNRHSISDYLFLAADQPLLIAAVALCCMPWLYRNNIKNLFLPLWLLASLIFSGISFLFIIPAAIICGAYCIEHLHGAAKPSIQWLILSCVCALALFGFIPAFPQALAQWMETGSFPGINAILALIIIPGISLAGIFLPAMLQRQINARLLLSIIMILSAIGILRSIKTNFTGTKALHKITPVAASNI